MTPLLRFCRTPIELLLALIADFISIFLLVIQSIILPPLTNYSQFAFFEYTCSIICNTSPYEVLWSLYILYNPRKSFKERIFEKV